MAKRGEMTEGQTEGFKYTRKLHVSFWPALVSASLSSCQPVTGRQKSEWERSKACCASKKKMKKAEAALLLKSRRIHYEKWQIFLFTQNSYLDSYFG